MPMVEKPSALRAMTEVEAAWVGAMIDGEGAVSLSVAGRERKPYRRLDNVRISVGNTDIEIISALLRATGTGRVTFQTQSYRNLKNITKEPLPFYCWRVGARKTVRALCERIAPYSSKAQRGIGYFSPKN